MRNVLALLVVWLILAPLVESLRCSESLAAEPAEEPVDIFGKPFPPPTPRETVSSVEFSPDGELLFAVRRIWRSMDGSLTAYSVTDGRELWSRPDIRLVRLVPESSLLLAIGKEATALFLERTTGEPVKEVDLAQWDRDKLSVRFNFTSGTHRVPFTVNSIAISSDGKKVFVGVGGTDSHASIFGIWNWRADKARFFLKRKWKGDWESDWYPHGAEITPGGVSLSNSPSNILPGSAGIVLGKHYPDPSGIASVVLLSLKERFPTYAFLISNFLIEDYVATAEFDRLFVLELALGDRPTSLAVWSIDQVRLIACNELPYDVPAMHQILGRRGRLAVSRDGETLALAGGQDLVLIGVDRLEERARLTGRTTRVYSLAFSPEGDYVAFGGDESSVFVWDIESRECRRFGAQPDPSPPPASAERKQETP